MCVSQIKYIKHIEGDFHSVPWAIPQVWDFGVQGRKKCNFSKHGHLEYQVKGDDEKNILQVKFLP